MCGLNPHPPESWRVRHPGANEGLVNLWPRSRLWGWREGGADGGAYEVEEQGAGDDGADESLE